MLVSLFCVLQQQCVCIYSTHKYSNVHLFPCSLFTFVTFILNVWNTNFNVAHLFISFLSKIRLFSFSLCFFLVCKIDKEANSFGCYYTAFVCVMLIMFFSLIFLVSLNAFGEYLFSIVWNALLSIRLCVVLRFFHLPSKRFFTTKNKIDSLVSLHM